MKGWLRRGGARNRRLLVARLAWLVLYPLTLGLLVVSMGSRFTELTAPDAGSGSLLRPAGGSYRLALFALEGLILIQYVVNTLFMAWRRYDDWVALYTSVGGVLLLVFLLPAPEALIAADPRWAGAVVAAQWLGAAMPVPFVLFFPDGHFVPRRSAILAFSWPVVWAASAVMLPGGSGLLTLPAVRLAVWLTCVSAGLTAQLYRFWKVARPIQRQQTKWVLASDWVLFVAILLVLPARFLADADLPPLLRPEVALPVYLVLTSAFGLGFTMALLKYRLWGIDVVIRRTLIYGALVAILGAMYISLVLGLQVLLGQITRSDTLAVALSTLATAALFSPARQRVREAVDRRFYRSRYDAARTLDAFDARLRNEADLDSVRANLLDVVDETIQPARASVWLRERT